MKTHLPFSSPLFICISSMILLIILMVIVFSPLNASAQAPTENEVERYLQDNPTEELNTGVINAGGLPSLEGFGTAENPDQIRNELGVQGGQFLITFIITSLLRLIGAFALGGVLYNALAIVIHSSADDKRAKHIKGLSLAVFGLIIVLFAHLIVTVIVQILNSGDTAT